MTGDRLWRIHYEWYITGDVHCQKSLFCTAALFHYISLWLTSPFLQTLVMSMQPISLFFCSQLFEPCSLSSDGLYLFPIPSVGNRYKPFEESLSLWLTSPFLQTIINNYMWQCPQLVEPCSLQVYICSRFQAQSGLVFESESKDSTCSWFSIFLCANNFSSL